MMRTGLGLLCLLAQAVSAQARSDTIVKYIGAPRHPGVASLVRELTIGGDVADPDYQFDKIVHMAVARDGNVWVLENNRGASSGGCSSPDCPFQGKSTVRVYSPDGKLVRAAGRSGMGPGEWQWPCGVHPLPDGRVLLNDCTIFNRYTFYRPDGILDTTWTLPGRTNFLGVDTKGNLAVQLLEGAMPRLSPTGGPTEWKSVSVWITPRGAIIDTFVPPPRISISRPSIMASKNGQGGTQLFAPYLQMGFQSWSPSEYFASIVTGRYAINLHLPQATPGKTAAWHDGDPITSLRRSTTLVAVTPEERRDQTKHLEAQVKFWGGTRSGPLPEIPYTKPPIKGASFDHDGRLWVGVSMPSERYNAPPFARPDGKLYPVVNWREPIAYDVLEPDGTYIGRVVLPYGVRFLDRPVSARGDLLWILAEDDDGIQSIVRYRIVWR